MTKNDDRCLDSAALCNSPRSKPNPITGDGPIRKGDGRREIIRKLQQMLIALTYDLGDYGPKKDGIDGIFGGKTFDAVKAFQEDKYYKDWEGESLNEDEFVGPRTSDALNRALVGIWYDFYQTDPKLTDEKLIVTVTPKFLTNGSLYLENIEQYKEVKIIVKTFPRDTVSEEEPRWKRLQREADAQWKYLEEVEKEAEEKEEEEERRKQYEGR